MRWGNTKPMLILFNACISKIIRFLTPNPCIILLHWWIDQSDGQSSQCNPNLIVFYCSNCFREKHVTLKRLWYNYPFIHYHIIIGLGVLEIDDPYSTPDSSSACLSCVILSRFVGELNLDDRIDLLVPRHLASPGHGFTICFCFYRVGCLSSPGFHAYFVKNTICDACIFNQYSLSCSSLKSKHSSLFELIFWLWFVKLCIFLKY